MSNAKDYLEQALNKAIEAQDQKGINKVSKELMRIYDEIASEYQQQNDFETALSYYEKCLSTTKNAKDLDK